VAHAPARAFVLELAHEGSPVGGDAVRARNALTTTHNVHHVPQISHSVLDRSSCHHHALVCCEKYNFPHFLLNVLLALERFPHRLLRLKVSTENRVGGFLVCLVDQQQPWLKHMLHPYDPLALI